MTDPSDYWIPFLINLVLGVAGIGLSAAVLYRAKRLLLLPVSVIAFLATNSLFLFVPYVATLDTPFPTSLLLYQRSVIAIGIFVAVVSVPLIALLMAAQTRAQVPSRGTPPWLPISLLVGGAAAVAYFLARNPELFGMTLKLYRAQSYDEYIEARNAAGDLVASRPGSGNGLITLAFGFFLPAGLIFATSAQGLSRPVRMFLKAAIWLTMLVPAIVIGSRMMLFFVLFFPVALWCMGRINPSSLKKLIAGSWKAILGGVLVLVAGTMVFQSLVHSTLVDSVAIFAVRALVAPGAVSGGYYWLFPDTFAFRGAGGIFMMPVPTDLVTVNQISIAATGIDSHANASILATAYSATGYSGCVAVSFVLAAACFATDLLLLKSPGRIATMLVVANFFGILNITSVPMRVAVVTHGYVVGPLIVTLLLIASRARTPKPMEAPSERPVPQST